MKVEFVDTNIFIRFITKDDEKKAKKVFELFKLVEQGKAKLIVNEATLAEVVYTLSSKKLYALSREKVKQVLIPIIEMKGLKIKNKDVFLLALDYMIDKKVDFEDALIAAYMVKSKTKRVYSYDRDFDKFKQIKRVEP
ncbi:MAG: PIN domain-containing protein [Patescibacteria group bacterium]|nr:PIN domain-containing protein [Patescibacteria group bacterium]